ncbi:gamma-glutamylcyclotransferase family protein [Pseudonocardia alaniniphila]|uniref:Gamma-glutamylcyclotransferase n=1 Tax=Pseudonocardia alaniniphila TaxID=75291 RepID=A0ABS9TDA5_9PSEU|nr:gamma-glutamylcyclotransferase family protein [Pseudonocardia alaniniphila]MCH6166378.1 gamma-glutamylcyclotransferase [Pseudonocardia alaniniphila]
MRRDEPHILFSYVTLQQCDVQLATFGRDRHPVLRPSTDPHAEVPGTAFSLTDAELLAVDRYEVDDYERIRVPLRSGRRAWVYAMKSRPGDTEMGRGAVHHPIAHLQPQPLLDKAAAAGIDSVFDTDQGRRP